MIRNATPEDVPEILRLIRDLAEYERALHEVRATEEQLNAALFGPEPKVFALIAEHEGRVVGFAVWFLTFSTWLGRHGIYLEDLYVDPEMRGRGYGRLLLAELARIADERGYGRVEWAVLKWNTPSIRFYESLGARPQDEWDVYRLTGDTIGELAESAVTPATGR
ncbi:GNAT family N-acetyltransferase [Actinomadura kijaniata]|uniref:GNAT superfamily N-acetyltransferase n=1 Tax=Actinomadura namibiensis TaxID=182080 RepID=A0A7W3LIS7_ACTNM|nr:GNAT family N-acetyltransferase [Actinomadura namibiensis]MBA8948948.1 GNAT superfamily N-acetyltransferase [Actinomadura namibiensis]